MLDLALAYGSEEPVKAADIASRQGISKKYLEQILTAYKCRGIVGSKSGKNGGYYLAKHPREITLAEALRVVEGPLAPVRCVSVTAHTKCPLGIEENSCALRTIWQEARDAMVGVLERMTLEDLVERERRMSGGRQAPMYYI